MLTTCPECRTTFRLGHAQLEARLGLVRCGYCQAVFNAYDTLLPEFQVPDPAGQPEPIPRDMERFAEYPPVESEPEFEPDTATTAYAAPDGDDGAASGPARYAGEIGVAEAMDRNGPEDEAFVLHLSDRIDDEKPKFEPPPLMPFGDGPDAILLSELPTRVQIEPDRQVWTKVLFGLLSLTLFLALLAQAAYFLRAPLVAWLPEARPDLEAACRVLGCRIPLASDIKLVRVESSSLETDPEQPNRAALRVNFSNRARVAQQWPYLILKLTDWKGGPLAQRAFGPGDYLPKDRVDGTGMAAMSEQEVRLDLDLGGLSASGYEVLPKYP